MMSDPARYRTGRHNPQIVYLQDSDEPATGNPMVCVVWPPFTGQQIAALLNDRQAITDPSTPAEVMARAYNARRHDVPFDDLPYELRAQLVEQYEADVAALSAAGYRIVAGFEDPRTVQPNSKDTAKTVGELHGGETWTEYGRRSGTPDDDPHTEGCNKLPGYWPESATPWLTRTVHATEWQVLPGERERVTAVIAAIRENAGAGQGPLPGFVEAQLPPVDKETT